MSQPPLLRQRRRGNGAGDYGSLGLIEFEVKADEFMGETDNLLRRDNEMTQIILVRHGETEWNVGNIFRGRADVELNQTGIKQAEFLGEYLTDLEVDAIYSSPLKRALKTAEMIAGYHNLDIEITDALIDLDFGEWQGLPREEVQDKYKDLYAQWINSPEQAKMPSGEGLGDVRERAVGLVNDVVTRYKGTVVLASHRVVNKVLICALLGLDNSHFWDIKLDTCGITTFDYENGRFILVEHNNTSFLKPLQIVPLSDF